MGLSDFGPVATIIVGLTAAYVARQSAKSSRSQAETARNKLRLDLYDRRLVLWDEVRQESRAFIKRADAIQKPDDLVFDDELDEIEKRLYRLRSQATFLFERNVEEQIRLIAGLLDSYQRARFLLRQGQGSDPYGETVPKAFAVMRATHTEYIRAREEFTSLVRPYLDFSTVSLRDGPDVEPASTIQGLIRMARANWRALRDEERWRG